jgi:trehalose synthase
MRASLDAYEAVVGPQVIDELRLLAKPLRRKRVQHVNSTAVGGGVAEILQRLVPLFQELGLTCRWDVIRGGDAYYQVTKKFHNALHGQMVSISRQEYRVFLETNAENLASMTLDGNVFFIHDPQPAGLIKAKVKKKGHWIWRCHIDVSAPRMGVWRFLERMVEQYDAAIFSAPQFTQRLGTRQFLVAPSIDPLSNKNRDLPKETVDEILHRLQIPRDRPLVTQVSRFDRLKDPVGVIEAFKLVRRSVACRLLLVGGSATDDPEGAQVLAEVREAAHGHADIMVMELPPTSNVEINAIQRASAVVVQKSLKEGFGLTVSEALWKGRPVVASAVGGIPLQVAHQYSGLLCRSIEGCALAIKQYLNNPAYAKRLGENGREHVRQHFLLTRHLKEYLLLIAALERKEDVFQL